MAEAGRRDALGIAFFLLHVAVLIYGLIGWALPYPGVYVVFVPLMALHWPLNRNTCVINNLESLMRTGRWRDPTNIEEGAWLRLMVAKLTGISVSAAQSDRATHIALVVFWVLGIWHWSGWATP